MQQPKKDEIQVEYDDEIIEGDNEEVIIFDNEDSMKEVGRKVQMGTKERLPDEILAGNDDDEIIDYFMENNPDWVIC